MLPISINVTFSKRQNHVHGDPTSSSQGFRVEGGGTTKGQKHQGEGEAEGEGEGERSALGPDTTVLSQVGCLPTPLTS